jgi:diaminopimelate decarboxylase
MLKKIAGIDIKELAEEFGTPLYVYDRSRIEENYKKLNDAFKSAYKKFHVHYAIKANSNPIVARILKDLGAGVDCSAPGEIYLAKLAGFEKKDIMYTGNYESSEDLKMAIDNADIINLDDLNSFKRLIQMTIPERVSFRINPGVGRGGFEGIVTAGSDAKFGIPYEKALEAYEYAASKGVKRFGIHMMTGSNNLEPWYFAEIVDKLMTIGAEIFNHLGVNPEYVDIGGGFGVPYTENENGIDLEHTAKLVCDIFKEKCEKYNLGEPELIVEPGRYLVANAGYLITKVTSTKESYRKYAGVDAGMNTLLRPALYGAYHHIDAYNDSTENEEINICGQICENSDIFARNRHLPKLDEGDLLIFRDAGAYSFSMSSNYNNRLRPAEVLISNNKANLIRKRENYEDLIRNINL